MLVRLFVGTKYGTPIQDHVIQAVTLLFHPSFLPTCLVLLSHIFVSKRQLLRLLGFSTQMLRCCVRMYLKRLDILCKAKALVFHPCEGRSTWRGQLNLLLLPVGIFHRNRLIHIKRRCLLSRKLRKPGYRIRKHSGASDPYYPLSLS